MKTTHIVNIILAASLLHNCMYPMLLTSMSATSGLTAALIASSATQNHTLSPIIKRFTRSYSSNSGMFKATTIKLMRWNYQESPESVLELKSPNPTKEELKKAHKKSAFKHHPDAGGKKENFVKVQDAYEYLTYLIETGQTRPNTNHTHQASTNSYKANSSYQNYNYSGKNTSENYSSNSDQTNNQKHSKPQNDNSSKDFSFRSTECYARCRKAAYERFGLKMNGPIQLADEFLDSFYHNNRDTYK